MANAGPDRPLDGRLLKKVPEDDVLLQAQGFGVSGKDGFQVIFGCFFGIVLLGVARRVERFREGRTVLLAGENAHPPQQKNQACDRKNPFNHAPST